MAQWKGLKLTHCAVVRSTKVWAELKEGEVLPADEDESGVGGSLPTVCKGSGCGHLFPVLMELPMPQWVRQREIVVVAAVVVVVTVACVVAVVVTVACVAVCVVEGV